MFLQMQLSSIDPGIRCFSIAVIISQSRFFKCSYHLSIQASDVFANAVIISRSRHKMFLQMLLSSLDPGIRCFCKCSYHLSIQASDVFANAVIISRSRHQMFFKCSYHLSIQVFQMQLSSLDPGIRCFSNAVIISRSRHQIFLNAVIISQSRHQVLLWSLKTPFVYCSLNSANLYTFKHLNNGGLIQNDNTDSKCEILYRRNKCLEASQ